MVIVCFSFVKCLMWDLAAWFAFPALFLSSTHSQQRRRLRPGSSACVRAARDSKNGRITILAVLNWVHRRTSVWAPISQCSFGVLRMNEYLWSALIHLSTLEKPLRELILALEFEHLAISDLSVFFLSKELQGQQPMCINWLGSSVENHHGILSWSN